MVVNWSLDSSRRQINVKYEHECIAELTDTEMHDFLVERKRPVGDGSRAAMELSMREWRGLGCLLFQIAQSSETARHCYTQLLLIWSAIVGPPTMLI